MSKKWLFAIPPGFLLGCFLGGFRASVEQQRLETSRRIEEMRKEWRKGEGIGAPAPTDYGKLIDDYHATRK